MQEKIKIDKINSTEFVEFVKKLLSVDKFIYIKLNADKIISNVYLPQRDAVKLQQIPIEQLFTVNDKVNKILQSKELKISFYNGTKIVEAFKMFTGDVSAVINYTETEGGYIANNFMLYDEDLKIKIACADPAINFMDLTDDQIKAIFNEDSKIYEFELTSENIENMNQLFNYEKDSETFDLVLDNGTVSFKGDNYSKSLGDVESTTVKEHTVKIYKKYLTLVDKEYYNVKVLDNKLILDSIHSDTRLTIAKCNV